MHSSIRMMRNALPSTSGICATVPEGSAQHFQIQTRRELGKYVRVLHCLLPLSSIVLHKL